LENTRGIQRLGTDGCSIDTSTQTELLEEEEEKEDIIKLTQTQLLILIKKKQKMISIFFIPT
jgi:hypothetical protein